MQINGKEYSDPELKAYVNMLLRVISDCRPILSMAFFADYKMQHKADAICFQIDNIMKGDKKI